MKLLRSLTGALAWIGLGAALFAQNAQVRDDLSVLVRVTGTIDPVLIALDNDGALLRSTNGGGGFTTIRPAETPRLLYTVAVSGETVVAMGDAGQFMRSDDGGANWTAPVPAVSGTFTGVIESVSAKDALNWVAVGVRNSSPVALVSTDGGATWGYANAIATNATQLHGVAWSGSRWVAVGEYSIIGGFGDGVILTSTDGINWTDLATISEFPLFSVASDGAGNVLIGGDAGTLLHATDGGATSSSFTSVGGNIVSEAIRSVAFLSGTNWVAGGDNAVIVTYNGTAPGIASAPSDTVSAPLTALAWTGTGANYYYSEPEAAEPPVEQGPISLAVAQVEGQLQLTLVGAVEGGSYYIETSATLTGWSVVAESAQTYAGGAAPTWSYPLPGPGERVFYRAVAGTP